MNNRRIRLLILQIFIYIVPPLFKNPGSVTADNQYSNVTRRIQI